MTPASYTSRYDEGGEQVRPDSRPPTARVLQTVASAGNFVGLQDRALLEEGLSYRTDMQTRTLDQGVAARGFRSPSRVIPDPPVDSRSYESQVSDVYAGFPYGSSPAYPSAQLNRQQASRGMASYQPPATLQSAGVSPYRPQAREQAPPQQASVTAPVRQAAPALADLQRPDSSLSDDDEQGTLALLLSKGMNLFAWDSQPPPAQAGVVEKVTPPQPDARDEEIKRLLQEIKVQKEVIQNLKAERKAENLLLGKALHYTFSRLPSVDLKIQEARKAVAKCVDSLFMAIPAYALLGKTGNGAKKHEILHHAVFNMLKEVSFSFKEEDVYQPMDTVTNTGLKKLEPSNIPDGLTPKIFGGLVGHYFFETTTLQNQKTFEHIASCLGKVMPRLTSSETKPLQEYCELVYNLGHDETILCMMQDYDQKWYKEVIDSYVQLTDGLTSSELTLNFYGSRLISEYGHLYPEVMPLDRLDIAVQEYGQASQQYV
jgi:hypothetical protein